jgi:hypothetical protein
MKLATKILEYYLYPRDSLKIPRDKMPQIERKDFKSLKSFFEVNSIPTITKQVLASTLKPSQKHLKTEKADNMFKNIDEISANPLIVSMDNYVIDGHHRWLCYKRNCPDKKLEVLQIQMPAKLAIEWLNKFPKSKKRDLEDNIVESSTFVPPKAAQKNALKAIQYKEKFPNEVTAMTQTGWVRARQLASGEPISLEIVKRMAAFNRHRSNSKVDPKYKDTPHKDNGHVAWLGWGGDEGIDWAIEQSKKF